MQAFRAGVEAQDFASLSDLLAENVVFRSPLAFKPSEGRPLVAAMVAPFDRIAAETTEEIGGGVAR